MGADLFFFGGGGQWPMLHAEEQARKKAAQEAQKLLKGSQPARRGERGNSSANRQPFRVGLTFQGQFGQGQFFFFRAKSRLHRASKSPQAQGLNPVVEEAGAGGVALMRGGHETPARRGSPPDPKGRVTGVAVEIPNDYPKDKAPTHRVGVIFWSLRRLGDL